MLQTKLKLCEVGSELLEAAVDKHGSAYMRVAVLRALEALQETRLTECASQLLADPQPAVRSEARRLLVKLKPEAAPP